MKSFSSVSTVLTVVLCFHVVGSINLLGRAKAIEAPDPASFADALMMAIANEERMQGRKHVALKLGTTASEHCSCEDAFAAMDTSGDARVSVDEVYSYAKHYLIRGAIVHQALRQVFTVADSNHDKFLDDREFCMADSAAEVASPEKVASVAVADARGLWCNATKDPAATTTTLAKISSSTKSTLAASIATTTTTTSTATTIAPTTTTARTITTTTTTTTTTSTTTTTAEASFANMLMHAIRKKEDDEREREAPTRGGKAAAEPPVYEIKNCDDAFAAMDTSGEGRISIAEALHYAAQHLARSASGLHTTVFKAFASADTNHDKYLTIEEFCLAGEQQVLSAAAANVPAHVVRTFFGRDNSHAGSR